MAAKKDVSKLVGQLASVKVDRVNLSRLLSPHKPSPGITAKGATGSYKPPASTDLKSQSLNTAANVKAGMKFGSPSSNKVASSQGTSEWAKLLKQTASGGISSAFGGGLMSAIGGLGGLVSSIAGLFGGPKKTLAPLTLFQLPNSQAHTVFVNAKSTGNASLNSNSGNSNSGGVSVSSNASSKTGEGQSLQNQSAEIAQAVKQALLNSSSLNDVIAEI